LTFKEGSVLRRIEAQCFYQCHLKRIIPLLVEGFGGHCFCYANIGTLGIDPESKLGLISGVPFGECLVMSIENLPQCWRFAGSPENAVLAPAQILASHSTDR
jgi:hypothetical protein